MEFCLLWNSVVERTKCLFRGLYTVRTLYCMYVLEAFMEAILKLYCLLLYTYTGCIYEDEMV